MAKRKRKAVRKRKTRRSTQTQDDYPGWMWMLFGLAIGLSVAFAIFMKDREADVPVRTAAQQPASMASSLEPSSQAAAPTTIAPEEPAASRFDFYEMLPNFEVIIPEQETNVSRDTQQEAVVLPGIYVLQAGSFTKFEDADRRRAQIALQGIESRIQRVTIDDKTYHRVRIGPTDDLDELNRLRDRLKQAKIDVLRIRLGD
jgi:cell division protein FtsN